MPKKKYIVTLTPEEREQLERLVTTGKNAAYKVNHARILLKADTHQADGGWTDQHISEALDISVSTIERVRQRFVEQSLDAALSRQVSRRSTPRLLDGEQEAKRILDKLELHYTPKHGSWLNMAEIELSVLARQCLDRRIPDPETLKREVAAWQKRRNTQSRTIDWQFSTEDARIKLKRLYPSISP